MTIVVVGCDYLHFYTEGSGSSGANELAVMSSEMAAMVFQSYSPTSPLNYSHHHYGDVLVFLQQQPCCTLPLV